MHEVAKVLVAVIVDVHIAGHIEDSLTSKGLAVGWHVTQIVANHKHLHHSLVWIEQSLGKIQIEKKLKKN